MKTQQSIIITANGSQFFVNSSFIVSATSSSGLPVTFDTTTPKMCSVNDNIVNLLESGIGTVYAHQVGNNTYEAVSEPFNFSIQKNSQKIVFGSVPDIGVYEYCFINAHTHSDLPITFTNITPNTCILTDSHLKAIKSGTCIIEAYQAGNSMWAPAPTVRLTFIIRP